MKIRTIILSLIALVTLHASTGCSAVEGVRRVRIGSTPDSCYVDVVLGSGGYHQRLPDSLCKRIPFGGILEIEIPQAVDTVQVLDSAITRDR